MLRVFVRVALIPTLLLVGILGLGVIATLPVGAAINNQISFQGKLTNPDGTNVTNGNYSIVFSLYTVSSGGTAVWTETQSSVSVVDGIFQVNLGSITLLPGSVDFNAGSIYLGVKVGADPEMSPRILFTASPYAFNSDKLGGISASGFVQLSPGSQQTGFINISGNATVGGTYNGNTFTSSALTFSGASAATIQSAATQAMNVTGNAASTISTTAGNITIQAGSGTVSFGTTTALTASGALTLTSGNATSLTIDSGTTGALNIGTSANAKTITIGNATGATTIAHVVGTGTNVFNIQGPASAIYMQLDTTNNRFYVGNPAGDTNAVILVLDNKTNAGDPTGVNGGQYYNSSNNKFRCYQNGGWQDCITRNRVTLAADVTNNNAVANTIADVTGLSFAVTSGVRYQFECNIWYTAAATTTGSRWSINGPTVTNLAYTSLYTLTATTNTSNSAVAYNIPAASNASSANTTGNNANIRGYLLPSANGTVIVRFASEIANSAITAKAGSSCEYWTP